MSGRPHRLDPERVVEHLPRLYRAARGWTDSREEAEDLVQETCAQLLARPRLVRGDDLGYLLRALRNTLISARRTRDRRPRTAELPDELAVADPLADPAARLAGGELRRAVAALPEPFRDAFVAVDVVGLGYDEAGRLLGVAPGTVASRLSRARDRLARALEDPPQ
ncbi:RNA polymerase sigma factor [Patulibacter defluvii]|uniref:RNA polymerase sigma factor n=1 Tax=Patulibacter defluvii TaxID=3095358 RepID=UPI002A76095A|nr:RNA polymerase sigma factor [Patulibacter sp. DM4]